MVLWLSKILLHFSLAHTEMILHGSWPKNFVAGGGMHEHEILSALAALYDAGSGDGSLAPNPRLAWQFQLLAKSSVPWSYGFFVALEVPPPPEKEGLLLDETMIGNI